MNINLVFLNIHFIRASIWASLGDQTVRSLPAMQETQVKDPLEKEMATHSSILA